MPKYMVKLWGRDDQEVFFRHNPRDFPLTKVNGPKSGTPILNGMDLSGLMGCASAESRAQLQAIQGLAISGQRTWGELYNSLFGKK